MHSPYQSQYIFFLLRTKCFGECYFYLYIIILSIGGEYSSTNVNQNYLLKYNTLLPRSSLSFILFSYFPELRLLTSSSERASFLFLNIMELRAVLVIAWCTHHPPTITFIGCCDHMTSDQPIIALSWLHFIFASLWNLI